MKLNYYLRGLGTGILAATLIFGVAGNAKEQVMTDSEILARAEQINKEKAVLSGSGQEEESIQGQESEVQTDASAPEDSSRPQEHTGPEETADQEERGETQSPVTEDDRTQAGQQTETEDHAQASSRDNEESVQQQSQTPSEQSEEGEQENNTGVKAAEQEMIVITINSGDSSETVSKKVAQAGLVASAEDYNRFLCSNGYDKKLNVGRHEIPAGADETEIAKCLTGRQTR